MNWNVLRHYAFTILGLLTVVFITLIIVTLSREEQSDPKDTMIIGSFVVLTIFCAAVGIGNLVSISTPLDANGKELIMTLSVLFGLLAATALTSSRMIGPNALHRAVSGILLADIIFLVVAMVGIAIRHFTDKSAGWGWIVVLGCIVIILFQGYSKIPVTTIDGSHGNNQTKTVPPVKDTSSTSRSSVPAKDSVNNGGYHHKYHNK